MCIEIEEVFWWETIHLIVETWSIRFQDALTDSQRAIEFDELNIKAFLRKGIALCRLDRQEEALQIFQSGLQIDGKRNH